MSLTIDDIRDAGFLSQAAYSNGRSAQENLAGSAWQYVNPAALGINAAFVDSAGYFNNLNAQALLAFDTASDTLAIAFRGTSDFTDLFDDLILGIVPFQVVYGAFSSFVSTVINNASNFGAARILVTGHSLGGAMVEEVMARHPDSNLVGVSFGSPGVKDIADAPGTDSRLINIGHIDLQSQLGSATPFTQQGDPVFRQTFSEHVQGTDIRVDLPDEPDFSLITIAARSLVGLSIGQHEMYLYESTASALAAELTRYQFDVRAYTYVIGTNPSSSGLNGTNYANVVVGDSGSDTIWGLSGDDILDGGPNNDRLFGGDGDDILDGGSGNDLLQGGVGNDRYHYYLDGAADTIDEQGFGGRDYIYVHGSNQINNPNQIAYRVTGSGHDLQIRFSSGGSVTIKNMDVGGSQVETLRLVGSDGSTQIGSDVDLVQKFQAAGSAYTPPPPPDPAPNLRPVVVGALNASAAGASVALVNYFPAIDPEGDQVQSYRVTSNAGGGYLVLDGNQLADGQELTFTADQYSRLQLVVGSAGTVETLTIRASDAIGFGSASLFGILSLNPGSVPVPQSVTAHDDSASTTSGHPIVLRVLQNDSSQLVQITSLAGADPQFIAIKPDTQDAIIVAPPSYFVGTYSFAYTATDGHGGTATAHVNVTVNASAPPPTPEQTNHAPVAPDSSRMINVGTQDHVNPLIFSYDPDGESGQLTLVGFTNGSHGTVALDGNTLIYTPEVGFLGTDAFSYTIQDPHGAQATGTIRETINQPPSVRDDFVVTNPNTPVTFNVLQNDLYTGSGHLTLHSAGLGPLHGSIVYDASGQITYSPTSGYTGVDEFVYLALDNVGGSGTAHVIVAVGSSSVQSGGSGNDTLTGTSSSDLLQGNGGDDTLWGGPGNDILDGGDGVDTVSLAGATTATSIRLIQPVVSPDGTIRWDDQALWANDGLGGRDSIRYIENVIGSEFADTIEGSDGDNTILGNGGDDEINPRRGHDIVYGGDGNDRIYSQGLPGFFTFFGGNGSDNLIGNVNVDYLDGGPGDDFLSGGGGGDTIIGGDGNDTVSGSGTVDGGNGNDTLRALSEPATLIGGAGDDILVGSGGNDALLGGDGNDFIDPGAGNNVVDGGGGRDELYIETGVAPLVIDLAAGIAQTYNSFTTLLGIEKVHARNFYGGFLLGSDSDDRLEGDFFQTAGIVGRGGDDVIVGYNHQGGGRLVIEGDVGADTLTGGSGNTWFVYRSAFDGADLITDFSAGDGGDVLDFSDVFTNIGYAGVAPIQDGFLRFVLSGSDTVVQLDADGFGTGAEFETMATLQGVLPTNLTTDNFSTPVDVDRIGAPEVFGGLIASDWTQEVSYQRGQQAVALGSMVVDDADPAAQLTVRLIVADPSVGSLSAVDGAVYYRSTGIWSIGGTVSQVNQALRDVRFVPTAGREADTAISTFVTDGVHAPLGGLIALSLLRVPTVMNGGNGDDVFFPHSGDHLIFGGLGFNQVDYRQSFAHGIAVDLEQGTATGGDGRHDSLFDIQAVIGTQYDDDLKGDAGNNRLFGLNGSDVLDGGAGADFMNGGAGDDTYYTDNSGDVIRDSGGIDTVYASRNFALPSTLENLFSDGMGLILTGNGLDNRMIGHAGDVLRGRAGDDVYLVDSPDVRIQERPDEGTDTVQSSVSYRLGGNVEDLVLTGSDAINGTGNDRDNAITGNDASNAIAGGVGDDILYGKAGDDRLNGGDGIDTIVGGLGRDLIAGGNGDDRFVYLNPLETGTTSTTRDQIYDFVQGSDKIDLSGMDAISGTPADDLFAFVETASFSAAGQLRQFAAGTNTVIEGDVTGDGHADFQILLRGSYSLTENDFLL